MQYNSWYPSWWLKEDWSFELLKSKMSGFLGNWRFPAWRQILVGRYHNHDHLGHRAPLGLGKGTALETWW